MYVDFTDLNKACVKESFPLSRISHLDYTAGHKRMSFLGAYASYNQITTNLADEEHTSFITPLALQCYTMMPFGLKNAGATFQRLISILLKAFIGKTVEAYIDNLIMKSLRK